MTTPLGQGSSTWARTSHLASLEWGMSRKKVLSLFADARVYPKYEGRNPRTGEPVVVRESIALPSSPAPIPELGVFASVMFDDAGLLDSITLKSAYPRPTEVTEDLMLQAANKVMAALDAEPLTALPPKPMTWKRKHTRVVLECDDDGFWFELSPVTANH